MFLVGYSSCAQVAATPIGARAWGLGNATTALFHQQSYFSNPAALGFAKHSFVNTSYHSRYGLSSLATLAASGTWATPSINVGIGAEKFGDKLYAENKVGLAIAKRLGNVALAIKTSYLNVSIGETQSRDAIITEFGFLGKLGPKLFVGFNAVNLTAAKLLPLSPLPTQLRMGFNFVPTGKVNILADAELIPGQKPQVRAGLEYAIHEKIALRSGVNGGVNAVHFGLGFIEKKWLFDYAINTHTALGLSHHFSLQLNMPRNEK